MALGDPTDNAMKAGLQTVIAKAGGIRELAEILHVNPVAVSKWDRVPAERLMQVRRKLGLQPEQLRPDLFKGAKP